MMRKLKAFVYNSKREFQADLQKIYNNCFTYNTDPVKKVSSMNHSYYCVEFTVEAACDHVEG